MFQSGKSVHYTVKSAVEFNIELPVEVVLTFLLSRLIFALRSINTPHLTSDPQRKLDLIQFLLLVLLDIKHLSSISPVSVLQETIAADSTLYQDLIPLIQSTFTLTLKM